MPYDDGPDDQLADEVITLLVTMNAQMSQYFASRAAELDLSAAAGKVLLALEPGQALSMRAIARKLGYDPSNLTGIVDKLENRDLIARQPDPTDRRVKALIATEHGIAVSQRLSERLRARTGPLAALNSDQLRELRSLLTLATGGTGTH